MISELQRSHHLKSQHLDWVFCAIPKNACSTLKYRLLLNDGRFTEGLSNDEVNRQVHRLARKLASPRNQLVRYAESLPFVAILRDPARRLVSAYLDKFYRCVNEPPKFVLDLAARSTLDKPVDQYSFADFVDALSVQDRTTYNEHWLPQADFLLDDVDYQFVDFEELTSAEIMREAGIDMTVNVRSHSTSKLFLEEDATQEEIDRGAQIDWPHLPVRALHQTLHRHRTRPQSHAAFLDPTVQEKVAQIYAEDLRLYRSVQGDQPGPASEPDPALPPEPAK